MTSKVPLAHFTTRGGVAHVPVDPHRQMFKPPYARELDSDRGERRSGRRPVILILVPSISLEV